MPAPGGGAAAAAAPAPEPAVAPPTSAIQVVPSQQAGQAPPSTGAAAAQPVLPPTLPLPAASAPAVEDNRPSRPGVGPSVTPAPVSFTPVPGLPTLPPQPPLAGPVPPAQLASAASLDPATCQTLGEVLAAIPEASNWTQLLKVCAASFPSNPHHVATRACVAELCGQPRHASASQQGCQLWMGRAWALLLTRNCCKCCSTAELARPPCTAEGGPEHAAARPRSPSHTAGPCQLRPVHSTLCSKSCACTRSSSPCGCSVPSVLCAMVLSLCHPAARPSTRRSVFRTRRPGQQHLPDSSPSHTSRPSQ